MEPITLYYKPCLSLQQECVPIIYDCSQTHAPYKDFCVLVLKDFDFGLCAGDVKYLYLMTVPVPNDGVYLYLLEGVYLHLLSWVFL